MRDPFDDLAAVWRKQQPEGDNLVRPSVAEDALSQLSARRDQIENAWIAIIGVIMLVIQAVGIAGVPTQGDQTRAGSRAPLIVTDVAIDLAAAACWARRMGANRRIAASATGNVRDSLQLALEAADREQRDLRFLVGSGIGILTPFLAHAFLSQAGRNPSRIGLLVVALSPVAAFLTVAIPASWYYCRVLPEHRRHMRSLLENLPG